MRAMTGMIGRRGLLGGMAGMALLRSVPAMARMPATNFITVGDWGRKGHHKQRAVGAQMGRTAAQIGSRFVVSVGDNFYEDGVTGLDDPQWKDSFEDIYADASLQTPWDVILGNHDYIGDIEAQLQYSRRSARWRMPARYYARREVLADGTPADIFYIDTNPFVTAYRGTKVRVDGQDTAAQLRWLDQALGRSDAPWKIVIGHHPVYTVSGEKHDTPELIAQLLPILRAHRVPIYVNGHVHNLQVRNVDGISFITCGAGSLTAKVKRGDAGEFSSDSHGFMTTAWTAGSFDFSFVDETGRQLYQQAIARAA